MAFNSNQISVGTSTPVQLIVQGGTPASPVAGKFYNVTGSTSDPIPGIIENTDGANPIYIGGSGVTTSNGFKLIAGAALPISFINTEATTLYALATGGTVVVGVLLGRQ